MYCIHCGRKLPEDGSVCACGNLQPGQNVPAEPQAAAPVEVPAPAISAAQPAQAPAYAQQPAPYGQPYTDTYQPQNPYAQPYVQNPYAPRAAYPYQPAQQARPFATACAAVKSLAASPLFLIGTIFVSLGFLLSLISAFIPVNYARLFSMLPPEVYYALDFSDLQYQLYMLCLLYTSDAADDTPV